MAEPRNPDAEARVNDHSRLRREIYLLACATILLPPIAGTTLMVFAGFYPFPEFFGIFTNVAGLVLAGFGLLAFSMAPRFYRFVVSLPERPPDEAVHLLGRFRIWGPVVLFGFVMTYSILGAVMADRSLVRMGLIEHRLSDNLVVASGPVPVALLTAIPIYSLLVDTLGRFLGARGLIVPILPIRTRLIFIGLATPFLIDTLLVGYYYSRTGYFSVETLLVWLLLLVLAAIGTYLLTRSMKQGLAPLEEFISRGPGEQAAGILGKPVVAASLDEHGRICERLNDTRTSLLEINRELRDQAYRLSKAERIAKIGSWTAEMDNTLTCSSQTYEIYGVDPRDDATRHTDIIYKMIHPDDLDTVQTMVTEALRTGKEYYCRHRIVRPDGVVRTLDARAEVVMDDAGRPQRMTGIVQDITDSIEMEERLRQSQKMEAIGNLTGGVAHDFNNLLAVILGNLELIQEQTEDHEVIAYADAAIRASQRGADLTRNMLSFARRAQLQPDIFDLNQVVTQVKQWAVRVLPENIDVETSLLAGLWKIEADQNSTQSALLNLVLNARDSMPSGGHLTIETSNMRVDETYLETRGEDVEPGRYVMLAVSDTGHGIDPADLDRIFDPFFTTKPPGSGSGLGLSMILGFMKQSGGTVRVYSEPGVGTTFKLYFKAVIDPAAPQIEKAASDVAPRKGLKVLLVEDETEVLTLLQNSLQKVGYDVTTASSGDQAWEILQDERSFDVVVTDIVMPGQRQGTHLAREVRQTRPDLPFIFLSGYANEAAVHGNGLHPSDIRLMKPISRSDLVAAVEKAVSAKDG